MEDLNILETRGYTTAFFDGKVGPNAHDYDSTRSSSDYQAAGVITDVTDTDIIMELRNEIKQGADVTFLLPGSSGKVTVTLSEIINAKNNEIMDKMSAGQQNSIKIPKALVNPEYLKSFVPLVVAYKKK
jgi:putative protease